MIRKSRKRNPTKDRKIKNKRGGGTPGTPNNGNLKNTIENKGTEKGGAVSSLLPAPPFSFPLFSIVFFRFPLFGAPGFPPSLVLDLSIFCLVFFLISLSFCLILLIFQQMFMIWETFWRHKRSKNKFRRLVCLSANFEIHNLASFF